MANLYLRVVLTTWVATCWADSPLRDFSKVEDRVDLLELNHKFDNQGRHVFSQVIAWERLPANGQYHVRAWKLIEKRESLTGWPVYNDMNQTWESHFVDMEIGGKLRVISSSLYRETFSQKDPESEDKKKLPHQLRLALNSGNSLWRKTADDPSKTVTKSETTRP